MIQLLVFHHKEKRWWWFEQYVRTPYKRGGIIEVYAQESGIDIVNRRSHLRVIRVMGNIFYDEGVQYRKGRVLLKKLPKDKRKVLRRTGRVDIKKEVFLQALEGEK